MFFEEEIKAILLSGIQGISYLYEIDSMPKGLNTLDILLTPERTFLVNDPWLSLGSTLLHPQKTFSMNDQMKKRDEWMSELFALGMIVLETVFMTSLTEQMYDKSQKQFKYQKIQEKIKEIADGVQMYKSNQVNGQNKSVLDEIKKDLRDLLSHKPEVRLKVDEKYKKRHLSQRPRTKQNHHPGWIKNNHYMKYPEINENPKNMRRVVSSGLLYKNSYIANIQLLGVERVQSEFLIQTQFTSHIPKNQHIISQAKNQYRFDCPLGGYRTQQHQKTHQSNYHKFYNNQSIPHFNHLTQRQDQVLSGNCQNPNNHQHNNRNRQYDNFGCSTKINKNQSSDKIITRQATNLRARKLSPKKKPLIRKEQQSKTYNCLPLSDNISNISFNGLHSQTSQLFVNQTQESQLSFSYNKDMNNRNYTSSSFIHSNNHFKSNPSSHTLELPLNMIRSESKQVYQKSKSLQNIQLFVADDLPKTKREQYTYNAILEQIQLQIKKCYNKLSQQASLLIHTEIPCVQPSSSEPMPQHSKRWLKIIQARADSYAQTLHMIPSSKQVDSLYYEDSSFLNKEPIVIQSYNGKMNKLQSSTRAQTPIRTQDSEDIVNSSQKNSLEINHSMIGNNNVRNEGRSFSSMDEEVKELRIISKQLQVQDRKPNSSYSSSQKVSVINKIYDSQMNSPKEQHITMNHQYGKKVSYNINCSTQSINRSSENIIRYSNQKITNARNTSQNYLRIPEGQPANAPLNSIIRKASCKDPGVNNSYNQLYSNEKVYTNTEISKYQAQQDRRLSERKAEETEIYQQNRQKNHTHKENQLQENMQLNETIPSLNPMHQTSCFQKPNQQNYIKSNIHSNPTSNTNTKFKTNNKSNPKDQKVILYTDGFRYIGQVNEQDERHGHGALYYTDGQVVYKGEWMHGNFNGKGRLQKLMEQCFDYRDLTRMNQFLKDYYGVLSHDIKEGRGLLKMQNNEVYEGQFSQDLPDGRGKFYCSDGSIVEGIWKMGVLLSTF